MWYETRLARLKAELDGIAELADSQTWIKHFQSRLDKDSLDLCVDVDLQVGDNLRPVTLTYPEGFPYTPPSIKPRGATVRWSGHQYGVGGELCLEHRADNWEPQITGVDMINSVYTLLASEDGVAQGGEPIIVESAHRTRVGQVLRSKIHRFLVTESLTKHLMTCEEPTPATFKITFNGESVVCIVVKMTDPIAGEWTDPEQPKGVCKYAVRKGFAIRVGSSDERLATIPRSGEIGAREMRSAFVGADATAFDDDETLIISTDANFQAYRLDFTDDTVYHYGMIFPDPGKRVLEANDSLASKKVAILGAGSIGSKVAMSLARSGVKKFVLLDEDVLTVENVARHTLDWESVGHHKVQSLDERLKLIMPGIEATSLRYNLGGQDASDVLNLLLDILSGCDLIIDATGSATAFNYAAIAAVTHSKSIAWARVFGGGYGGLIARSRPVIDPPPHLARAAINAWCANPGFPKPPAELTDYGATSESGEPMIADDADVSAIAAHFTRFIIDTLVATDKSSFEHSAYLIGLREEWIFRAAFDTWPIDLGSPPAPLPEPSLPEEEAALATEILAKLKEALAKAST